MRSIFIITNTMGGGGAERVVAELEQHISSVKCRVVTWQDSNIAYNLATPPPITSC